MLLFWPPLKILRVLGNHAKYAVPTVKYGDGSIMLWEYFTSEGLSLWEGKLHTIKITEKKSIKISSQF